MQNKKWEQFRKGDWERFVCLNGSEAGKQEWLSSGAEQRHIFSARQIESFILLGYTELPKEFAFEGSLEEFISLFPKQDTARSKALLNQFLQGVVAEYKNGIWEFFTCNVVVMGCCMGEYFSVANRKEVLF